MRHVRDADGIDSLSTADTANLLADCFFRAGRFNKSGRMVAPYARAIVNYKRLLGVADSHLISMCYRLGVVVERQKKLMAAENAYKDALSVCRENGDMATGPLCVLALSHLADVYRKEKNLLSSDRTYHAAATLWRKRQGGELNAALCSYRMGQNATNRGDYAMAISYYKQALPVMQSTWGSANPQLYSVLADYSNALKKDNRWIEGLQMTADARSLINKLSEQ